MSIAKSVAKAFIGITTVAAVAVAVAATPVVPAVIATVATLAVVGTAVKVAAKLKVKRK